jgi:hypothetical protein
VSLPPSLTSIRHHAFESCVKLTSLSLPAKLSSIEDFAFYNCQGLTSVSLPPRLNGIGNYAFQKCSNLGSAVFTGNSAFLGTGAFSETRSGFTIYYLKGQISFTSPMWRGYPAIMIDPVTQPAATWLLAHGQAYDANLATDTNRDGVSLLLAYALNLDPRLNLSGSLPQAALNENTLGLTFYAVSPGLTYRVEASADLSQWSTIGVTQSPLDRDGRSTATVPRSGPYRFLRLAVNR